VRAFDLGPVTLDVGLEAGAGWFLQAFHDPKTPDRTSFGPLVGALGQLIVPLPRRFYARVELAGLFYFMRATDGNAQPTTSTAPTWRGSLGVGMSF
jgi:hypothetical protein